MELIPRIRKMSILRSFKAVKQIRLAFEILTLLCGVLLLAASLPVCASQGPSGIDSSTQPATPARRPEFVGSGQLNQEYIIAADDVLNVSVIDVPQLSQDYRVSPDGTIMIPLLSEPIEAEGLTPRQLTAVISEKLRRAGLVSHPFVTVTVKASRVNSVAITGAVRNPQIYPLFGSTTLLDVLSQAGGLSNDAADTAIVTRGDIAMRTLGLRENAGAPSAGGPAQETVKVDLRKLLQMGDPSANIVIYPGDTVTVQRAGIVYVVGAVNRAGGYTLAGSWQDMTVLKAIALAGNVTSTAIQKKTVIIRKDSAAPAGREEIPINLKKILAGRAPDHPLEANDILFVPDSTAKKAFQRGAQAALGVGTGLLIYRAPL